ncbi:DUF4214 domain-containing protein [Oceanicoccus sagamiensis]|uniref:DUF4214 domain-containing protein n=1 Tax=Oceanicoccus sagamiensis TaxID=716816 RepID=A0A1X9NH73_9GAMM|nr:DUF4214 domain-containing protein [Oceanicoccus sagamiensis]ARN74277.1 hypothetical protein BST96_09170 [Oceanicoccus sagamiensis]
MFRKLLCTWVLLTLSFTASGQILATQEDTKALARLYSAAFDRLPDIGGLNFWVDSFEQGRSISSIAGDFNRSAEFTSKYGELNNLAFIRQLYRNVLGREGESGGVEFWTGHLDAARMTRDEVLADFAGSRENVIKTDPEFNALFKGPNGQWSFSSIARQHSEGFWYGESSDNRLFTSLITDQGRLFVIYSEYYPSSNPLIAGVIVGDTYIDGSALASTQARDYNLEGYGVSDVQIKGTLEAKKNFSGSIQYRYGSQKTFTSTYDRNYELAPSFEKLSGTYNGEVAFSLGVEGATISIDDNGDISGQGWSGCVISGTATKNNSGNFYDISLSFGGNPCYFSYQTFSGVAAFYAPTGQLIVILPNDSNTDGLIFISSS